jgi:hypothetical protein
MGRLQASFHSLLKAFLLSFYTMPCNKAANEFSRVYNEDTIIIPAVRVEATAFDFQKRRTFSMRSSLVADEI